MTRGHRRLGLLATLAIVAALALPSSAAASAPAEPSNGSESAPLPAAASVSIAPAAAAPEPAAALPDPDKTSLSGTLVITTADDFEGRVSQTVYTIVTPAGATPLAVTGAVSPSLAGALVSVSGRSLPDGSLAVSAASIVVVKPAAANTQARALGLTAPTVARAAAAAQTRKVAVIIARYKDVSGYPLTNAQAAETFTTAAASVKSYFETASRGRVTTSTTVLGPYNLGIARCPYNYTSTITAAIAQANAHGVSLDSYQHVIVWTKGPCGQGWWGMGDVGGRYVHMAVDWALNPGAATSAFVAAHEMGHNLGLAHADGLRCNDGGENYISLGSPEHCTRYEYYDYYSTLGIAGLGDYALLDAERLRSLGWLDSGESRTITSIGTYSFVPTYSATAGVRLIRIVRPAHVTTSSGPGGWTLELRSNMAGGAWDQLTGSFAPATTGVSIRYSEMPSYGSYAESYMVDYVPGGDWLDAPYPAGSTFTDTVGGITIHIDSVTASGATVTIGDTLDPGAPTGLQAAPLATGGAELDWQAATDNLGLAHYRIYRDGAQVGEVSGSTLTFTDPPAGFGGHVVYTVTAVDSAGNEGPAATADATLAGPPSPPLNVVASRGNSAALVSWNAPADGAPFTGYEAVSTPGSFTCSTTGATSCVVDGLSNGTPYTFKVRATNIVGTGDWSASSAAVTPIGVPGRPTSVTGSFGNTQVTVGWSAPPAGDSAISGYTVTAAPGGGTCSWSSGPLHCTVTGLTNGQAYTFTVTATNDQGTGLASDPSAPVVPATAPGAPVGVTAVGKNVSAVVRWSAPISNGGHPIDHYDVTFAGGGVACAPTAALSCTVTGLTNRVSYQFKVTATTDAGTGPASAGSNAAMPLYGATYVPVTPNRLVDSRIKLGLSSYLTSKSPASFQVTGRSADPALNIPTGAVAVTGNLTTVNSTSAGYLSLTPTNQGPIPPTSTLNFPAGDIRANSVTVPLGPDGKLWVTFVGSAGKRSDAVFDVTGYFIADTSGATYKTLTPNRILDSRAGTRLGMSASLISRTPAMFQVTGLSADPAINVPSNAVAVVGNLTAVNQRSKGYLSLTPTQPSGIPSTSTINFPAGDTRANALTVPLGPSGELWVTFVGSSGTTADVIFDVTGYYVADTSGATYVPLTPNRLVDSRGGLLGLPGSLTSPTPAQFSVTDQSADPAKNVPSTAVAVDVNVTAVNEKSRGYFSLTPEQPAGIPSTSTLNFPTGDIRANALTIPLGPGGTLWVTFVGTTGVHADVVVDVMGYFTMA